MSCGGRSRQPPLPQKIRLPLGRLVLAAVLRVVGRAQLTKAAISRLIIVDGEDKVHRNHDKELGD